MIEMRWLGDYDLKVNLADACDFENTENLHVGFLDMISLFLRNFRKNRASYSVDSGDFCCSVLDGDSLYIPDGETIHFKRHGVEVGDNFVNMQAGDIKIICSIIVKRTA
jgi:hypothetical protein